MESSWCRDKKLRYGWRRVEAYLNDNQFCLAKKQYIFYFSYKQMRIDFSLLEQEQGVRLIQKPKLDNNLANFWQKQEKMGLQQLKVSNQQKSPIKFTVTEPFRVSRSLSPQTIKKQMSYLKVKQILPSSTLNFIESSLTSIVQRNVSQIAPNKNTYQTPARNLHSIYFQNSQKFDKNIEKSRVNKKENSPVKVSELGRWTQKRAEKKAEKMVQKVNEVLKAKKQKEFEQLTHHPMLNYTMNNRVSKKVIEKRKDHFKSTHSNVFQSLFDDATRYQSKKEVERIRGNQELNNQKYLKRNSKIQINSSFQDRLIRSLQNSAERKKKAQNKQDYDPSTGRKMFVPDTHLSKLTYFTHFKSTESIDMSMEGTRPARHSHYAEQSIILNKSNQDLTTYNCSYEDISQQNIQPVYKHYLKPQPGKRQEKLAQIYADLIFKHEELDVGCLSPVQKRVLTPFLQMFCNLEYGREASRQVFLAVFKDFIGRINLFDKEILFRRFKKPMIEKQSNIQDQSFTIKGKVMQSSNIKAPDHSYKFYYV